MLGVIAVGEVPIPLPYFFGVNDLKKIHVGDREEARRTKIWGKKKEYGVHKIETRNETPDIFYSSFFLILPNNLSPPLPPLYIHMWRAPPPPPLPINLGINLQPHIPTAPQPHRPTSPQYPQPSQSHHSLNSINIKNRNRIYIISPHEDWVYSTCLHLQSIPSAINISYGKSTTLVYPQLGTPFGYLGRINIYVLQYKFFHWGG